MNNQQRTPTRIYGRPLVIRGPGSTSEVNLARQRPHVRCRHAA